MQNKGTAQARDATTKTLIGVYDAQVNEFKNVATRSGT
jgi:hypothetical protein